MSDAQKKLVATAAIEYLAQSLQTPTIVGIGTGSTANFFIDMLTQLGDRVAGAVASSESSAQRLRDNGIKILDLNELTQLDVYIDGADEINPQLMMLKGGGGALTREKIVAATAKKFICIADQSKYVDRLGRFPLPVEVIPLARAYVERQMRALGGKPVWRSGFTTDNGNIILDAHDLVIDQPVLMEGLLNDITGVVCNGLFALRPADVLLLGDGDTVKQYPA